MPNPIFKTPKEKWLNGLLQLELTEADAEALIAAGLETPKKAKAADDASLKAAGLTGAKVKKIKDRAKA